MNAPAWAAPPEASVFVNCPFDEQFSSQRDAIVLTCVYAGLVPWFASSSGRVAVSRMDRIVQAIEHCRYSIHDLSRYQGEGPNKLARFNMPLELGMAIGRRGSRRDPEAHDWMAMVPEEHRHAEYLSDLAGHDLKTHDGSPTRVAAAVWSWFAAAPDADVEPFPRLRGKIAAHRVASERLREDSGGEPPWREVLRLAREVVAAD